MNKQQRSELFERLKSINPHPTTELEYRTGLAPGKNVLQVEEKLLSVVPKEYALDAHHWLILHGRYVCKARKPVCYRCVLIDLCRFKPKTVDDTHSSDLLPAKKPATRKAKPTKRKR